MPEQPEQPSFLFEGFAFDRMSFATLPRVPLDEGETLQPGITCDLVPNAELSIDHDSRRAELALSFKITADPKKQPYVVEVAIVGKFALQTGTLEQLVQFAKHGAAAVLFPYIREMVYYVTRDGRWGPLRLNPMNIQSILKWRDDSEPEPNAPNAPAQQPEQSPSASPDSKS